MNVKMFTAELVGLVVSSIVRQWHLVIRSLRSTVEQEWDGCLSEPLTRVKALT
jgi:hypothetical protein